MRRPLPTRLFAGLFAFWFGVAMADPPGLHRCPMHDLPATVGVQAGPGGVVLGVQGHRSGHRETMYCTCPGVCAGAGMVPAGAAPSFANTPAAASIAVLPGASSDHARRAAQHFLPFADGPPVLS